MRKLSPSTPWRSSWRRTGDSSGTNAASHRGQWRGCPVLRNSPNSPSGSWDRDVVSLHCPLTDETRGLIGAQELSAMKKGSMLVNMARGGVVDEAALAAALQDPSAPLSAAAVDVFAKEHADFDSPLMGLDNVILTPHIAGMTRAAAHRAADGVPLG
ncbi:NAD(P)-dependent oxidoreductase [Streptomyces sp. NPDC001852]|uniref:NAD(P)-dependent oxidoreductase n=1 Tax=Streptomyces sp. NPDC001852 TaxID=3364619 RepID=UPI0036C199B8